MEESDDFKLAVKVVIKRQMKDLMEQLRERGEEIAVLTVDLEDNSYSHFGSPNGEWFLSQQKNIPQSFLSFCQSNTNQVASQTTVTAVSPKKKSIASLRSASKQNTSTEVPEVRVTVPKKLAGDLSEEEVAALVGRIVATHLAFQEKGDGSSSGTQFDVLLKTANQSKHKGNSSIFATPRSARKRKPTAKFMEGMSSLKKGRKIDDEETNEMEVGNEEMFGLLSELSNTVLRRVKVTVPNNKTINLEKSSLDTSETTEALAVYIIQELDAVCGSQLANRNSIKLIVIMGGIYDEDIKIDMTITTVKNEIITDDDKENKDDNVYDNNDDKPEIGDEDDNDYSHLSFDDGDSDMEDDLADKSGAESDSKEDIEKLKSLKRKIKNENAGKKKRIRKQIPSRNLPVQCDICGMRIIGTYGLFNHKRRVHFQEKNHKCLVCSKGFFHNAGLQSHLLTVHTRQCRSCGKFVNESQPWEAGITSKSTRRIRCECGNDVVIRRTAYRKSKDESQPKEKTSYPCEYCGKLFFSKYHCARHTKLHTNKKANAYCYICGESFKLKKQLRNHRAEVHDIQDFQCKFCPQYFSTPNELEDHLVLHPEHQEEEEETERVVVMSTDIEGEVTTVTTDASGASNELDSYSKLVNDVMQQFGGGVSSIIIKSIDS